MLSLVSTRPNDLIGLIRIVGFIGLVGIIDLIGLADLICRIGRVCPIGARLVWPTRRGLAGPGRQTGNIREHKK